jgi:hypothetical protein
MFNAETTEHSGGGCEPRVEARGGVHSQAEGGELQGEGSSVHSPFAGLGRAADRGKAGEGRAWKVAGHHRAMVPRLPLL